MDSGPDSSVAEFESSQTSQAKALFVGLKIEKKRKEEEKKKKCTSHQSAEQSSSVAGRK